MSWTDADIAPASKAWTDADIAPQVEPGFLESGGWLDKNVTQPMKGVISSAYQVPTAAVWNPAMNAASNFVGAAADLYSKARGTAPIAEDVVKDFRDKTHYTPSNPYARALLDKGAEVLAPVSQQVLEPLGPMASGLGGEFSPAIATANYLRGRVANAANVAINPSAEKFAQMVRDSRNNSPAIANAKAAAEGGYTLNPATTNPTISNIIQGRVAGKNNVNNAAFDKNQLQLNSDARSVLGVEDGTGLSDSLFKQLKNEAAAPVKEVEAMPSFTTDDQYLRNISGNSFLTKLPENEQAWFKKSPEAAKVIEEASVPEMTGLGAIKRISDLNNEASTVLKGGATDPDAVALANVKRTIAREMEDNIIRRLSESGNTKLATDLDSWRKNYAQVSAIDDATVNGNLDALKLAKDRRGDSFTGKLADIRRNAQLYPEVFKSYDTPPLDSLKRYGYAGMLGGALGTPFGATAQGMAIGAAVDPLIGAMVKRRMTSEVGQRSAIPTDYRPMREQLGYDPIKPPAELSLAEGPFPPRETTGQIFGKEPVNNPLLQIGDRGALTTPRTPLEMPIANFPIEPRLNPMYQRGGIPQGPQVPQAAPEKAATYPNGIPYSTSELPPVLPVARESSQPLPAIPDHILPLSQQYPQGLSIGAAEGRMPQPRTPFPKLHPDPRSTMELAEPQATAQALRQPAHETIDFPLKTEVLQQPAIVKSMEAFRAESERLQGILNNKYIIDRGVKAKAAQDLQALQEEFGRGAHLLGGESAADFYGPNYQLGARFGVNKTFDGRNMAEQLRKQP